MTSQQDDRVAQSLEQDTLVVALTLTQKEASMYFLERLLVDLGQNMALDSLIN